MEGVASLALSTTATFGPVEEVASLALSTTATFGPVEEVSGAATVSLALVASGPTEGVAKIPVPVGTVGVPGCSRSPKREEGSGAEAEGRL